MLLKTRALTESDRMAVLMLESVASFEVSEWLDSEDSVWGIFDATKLIGFCTMGYADDCCETIENYPGWTMDSLLLCNVYVLREYRHKGVGTKMIQDVLSKHSGVKGNLVFLTLLYADLQDFYSRLGFVPIDSEYAMVKQC